MLRLQRYLLRELLTAFVLVLLLITGIFVAGSLLQLLQKLPELSVGALLRSAPMLLPLALPVTVPLSFLMACLLSYGRFADDNEFLAFQMGGVSPWHAVAPAVASAVALSVATLWVNTDVNPVMTIAKRELARGEIRQVLEHMRQPGVTHVRMKDLEMSWDGRDGGWYRDVFLTTVVARARGPGGERDETPFRVTAGRAWLQLSTDGVRLAITLKDARIVSQSATGEQPVTAGEMQLVIDVDRLMGEPLELASKGADSMRSDQLWYRMQRLEPQVGRRRDTREAELLRRFSGEYWKRFALGISPLAFALLGAPIGLVVRRGSRAQALVMALFIALPVYYPLLLLGEDLNRKGVLDAPLALNLGNLVLGAVGAALIARIVTR